MFALPRYMCPKFRKWELCNFGQSEKKHYSATVLSKTGDSEVLLLSSKLEFQSLSLTSKDVESLAWVSSTDTWKTLRCSNKEGRLVSMPLYVRKKISDAELEGKPGIYSFIRHGTSPSVFLTVDSRSSYATVKTILSSSLELARCSAVVFS